MGKQTKKELVEQGYRIYAGQELDVYFNLSMCQHSAHCLKSDHAVFDTKRKPWIVTDNASGETVTKIIDGCPSGALQYLWKEEY